MELFIMGMVTGAGMFWAVDYAWDWVENNIFRVREDEGEE